MSDMKKRLWQAIEAYRQAGGRAEHWARRDTLDILIDEVFEMKPPQTLSADIFDAIKDYPLPPPPARDYSINAAATVAVSNEVFLEPCDHNTPRGAKVQLLTIGGVLVYGHYNGDRFYTHWAPCPRRRKEVTNGT